MTAKKLILTRKNGLYLKDAGDGKGRGLFCTAAIRKGETLEIAPAILLDEAETVRVDRTILENYTFVLGGISDALRRAARIPDPREASVIIMGVTSFCNHSKKPNADIFWEEHDGGLYYTLMALRRIPAHSEICTSYGKGWFEDRGFKSKG